MLFRLVLFRMNKNSKLLKQRVDFNQTAITDPKKAANKLRSLAYSLEKTKNTSDVIFALSQIFCISERTVMRDIINDTL